MDKLSFELISLIVDKLQEPDVDLVLAPYATISRQWQAVVERRTFAYLDVRDLSSFQTNVTSSPSRLAALRDVVFLMTLPTDGESRADYRQNQSVVLAAITSLCAQLADAEAKMHRHRYDGTSDIGPIKLTICYNHFQNDHLVKSHKSAAFKRQFEFSEKEVEALPKVSCISSLRIWTIGQIYPICESGFKACDTRSIHPLTSCQLATRFSGLKRLELRYRDPALKRTGLRRAIRSALAQGVHSLGQLSQFEELCIERVRSSTNYPANHSFENSCLEHEDEQSGVRVDPLCEAIRKLAQNGRLQRLLLDNELVSPDLFRDRRSQRTTLEYDSYYRRGKEGAEAEWPSLRSFVVYSDIVAPSGRWYYTGNKDQVVPEPADNVPQPQDVPDDDGETNADSGDSDMNGDTDSEAQSDADVDDVWEDAEANGTSPRHRWRTRPNPEEIDPLFLSLAAAVHRMPRLEIGYFRIAVGDAHNYNPTAVRLRCYEAGERAWNAGKERLETVISDETQEACRLWEIEFDEDIMAWEVPPELKRQCVEWVGPGGMVLTGQRYGASSA
ncbi:hypothetical protein PG984_015276 [Apiospora sp. TS-2023a]